MSKEVKVKLSMINSNEHTISKMQEDLLKLELEEIENKYPLQENQIRIDRNYVVEFDDHIEIGVFIRNTLTKSINFEHVPIVIMNSDKEVIYREIFNLMDFGTLPPMSARPWKIEIAKHKLIKPIPKEGWSLMFDIQNNSLKAVSTVEMKIENIPDNMNYKEKKEILDFFNSLLKPRKGTFDINKYKLNIVNNKEIHLTIIMRNATDKNANLEVLPINIVTKNGTPIMRNIYKPQEPFTISATSAKILSFIFKVDEDVLKAIDENELMVVYQ